MDIGSSVQGWLSDLNGIIGQAVEIKQQVDGPTSPVTVAAQAKPSGDGLSTGMIAMGVIGLILVVVIIKKVL